MVFGFGVLILVLGNSLIRVPPYHAFAMDIFGRLTGRVLRAGLHPKWPFFENVAKRNIFSLNPIHGEVRASFTTKDKVHLNYSSGPRGFQFRPDPSLQDNREVIFLRRTVEEILGGISSDLEAKLNALGGTINSDDFIINLRPVADILNMFVRVEVPYHLCHDSTNCGFGGCTFPKQVPGDDLIDFYNKHWPIVKATLDHEQENPDDHSTTERRYGIDTITLPFKEISFSRETTEAMEEERQVAARAAVVGRYVETVEKITTVRPDASAQMVLDEAGRLLDPGIKKEIKSFEGDPIIAALASKSGSK